MRTKVVSAALGIVALLGVGAPVAAQSNLKATATAPTKVDLTWTAASGANGYVVQRTTGNGPLTSIMSAKIPGTAYTDLTAPSGTTLKYRVRASYANGGHTYSDKVNVSTPSAAGVASAPAAQPAPAPAATAGSTAAPASTAQVPLPTAAAAVPSSPTTSVAQLTPLRLAETAPVLVTGPKLAIAPTTSAAAPSTPAPAPAPAVAATPVSGRYRVVANGFSVVHESFDDMLSRDGKYDEVYGGFAMFHFDRKTGDLLDRDLRRTKVLGDINNFPDRLRAGTASGSGGLRAGDSYPDAGHARYRGQDGAEPNSQTFPFKVWEGTLTNGADAAVILPTMWEQDNDGSPYDLWFQAEVASASQIWFDPSVQQAVKQTALGVIAPPGSITPNMTPTFGAGAVAASSFFAALGQPWVGALFAGSRDRPIGMVSTVIPSLPRRAIVLTREIIEQALSGSRVLPNPASLAPAEMWLLAYLDVPVGVIPVLLRDGPGSNLQATYVLYLQVERL